MALLSLGLSSLLMILKMIPDFDSSLTGSYIMMCLVSNIVSSLSALRAARDSVYAMSDFNRSNPHEPRRVVYL